MEHQLLLGFPLVLHFPCLNFLAVFCCLGDGDEISVNDGNIFISPFSIRLVPSS